MAEPSSASTEQRGGTQRTLERAQHELIAICMRDQGFRYSPARPKGGVQSASPTPHFPYGIDDPQWAQRNGYDALAQQRSKRQPVYDPNARYLEGLSESRREAFTRALYGDPSGQQIQVKLPTFTIRASAQSCDSEAQEWLYGDFAQWFRSSTTVLNLQAMTHSKVVQQEDYERALSRWSTCVQEKGYKARHPSELYETYVDAAKELSRTRARELGVEMATAEARCVQQTRLSDVGSRVEKSVTNNLHRQYRQEIRTVDTARKNAAPRATFLLSTLELSELLSEPSINEKD